MTERTYRTSDQMVADLEAKIASIKARDQRRAARKNPAVQQAIVAVKAMDKSLASGADPVLKGALQEARVTLAAAVATTGVVLAESTRGAAPVPEPAKRARPRVAAES